MEIIIMIILGLVSMLFSKLGNRQEETQRQQRPATSNPRPQAPKKLEDYARELFEQFEEPKRQIPEPVRPVENQQPIQKQQKPEPIIEKVSEDLVISKRHTAIRTTQKRVEKRPDVFPKNEQELLQAFIFSEVIAPPKSKR